MPKPAVPDFLKHLPAALRDGQGLQNDEDVYLMGATPEGDFALYKLDRKQGRFAAVEVDSYVPDASKEGAGILKLVGGDTLHMETGKTPLIHGKPTQPFSLEAPAPEPAQPVIAEPVATEPEYHRFPEMKRDSKTPPGEAAKMQEMLRDLGFGKQLGTFGPKKDGVDDIYGSFTASSVRAFQIANDILPTGDLDRRTADLLAKKHYEQQNPQVAQNLDGPAIVAPVQPAAGPAQVFNGLSANPSDITHVLYQQMADAVGMDIRSPGVNMAALKLPPAIDMPDTATPDAQRPRPHSPGMGGAY